MEEAHEHDGLTVADLLLQLEAAEEVFEELAWWKAHAIELGASDNDFARSRLELLPPPEPEPVTGARVREVLQAFPGGITTKELALELDATVAEVRVFLKPMILGGAVRQEGRVNVFVPAPGDSSPRVDKAPPEKDPPAYVEARATGTPVRIRTERKDRKARSTPGSRQKTVNQQRNWERLQAAKAERAEANRRKEQKPAKWERKKARNKSKGK